MAFVDEKPIKCFRACAWVSPRRCEREESTREEEENDKKQLETNTAGLRLAQETCVNVSCFEKNKYLHHRAVTNYKNTAPRQVSIRNQIHWSH